MGSTKMERSEGAGSLSASENIQGSTAPPDEADLRRRLFPEEVPRPERGVFELGLVLGGTASCGAYTAGALDFLIEALEAWEASGTRHKVVLQTAAGTSGGAMNASILALLSSRARLSIDAAAVLPQKAADTGNPFWDIWINRYDVVGALATDDLDARIDYDAAALGDPPRPQRTPSLLCACYGDSSVEYFVAFAEGAAGPARPFFAMPFRFAITLSDLVGVPYAPNVRLPAGAAWSGYVRHDDFAWFALPNGLKAGAALPAGKRADEFWLDPAAGRTADGYVGYRILAEFAAASAAAPLIFAPRTLARPASQYSLRPFVRPGGGGGGDRWDLVEWPEPDWSRLACDSDGERVFTAVDGGVFDNDPVSLVHLKMSGLFGRDPRDARCACRAMLMIDPLADGYGDPDLGRSLPRIARHLASIVTGGVRYLTADMDLFANEDVFSRFRLTPTRAGAALGAPPLTGRLLFGMAAWCSRKYRVHDFLLGRSNMQAYLATEMLLPGDNHLFHRWDFDARRLRATDSDGRPVSINEDVPKSSYWLPILPDLTGRTLDEPVWPAGAFRVDGAFRSKVRARLSAVLARLARDNLPIPLGWLVARAGAPIAAWIATKAIADAFADELDGAKLAPLNPLPGSGRRPGSA